MSIEKDRLFFRNFALLVVLLAVMMAAFGVIAGWAGARADLGRPTDERIVQRTEPVGQVRIAGIDDVPRMDEMPSAAPPPGEEPVAAGAADGAPAATGEAMAGVDGEAVYNGLCVSCHSTGIPGIPQLGDQALWGPRIAKGMEALYANAINGYTGESGMPMPARGGNPDLSDAEVQAAVDFMVEKAK